MADDKMDRDFAKYELKNRIRRPINRLLTSLETAGVEGIVDRFNVPNHYSDKYVMSNEETNAFISNRILSSKPLMVARFGAVELNYVYHVTKRQIGEDNEKGYRAALDMLCFNAGFFPRAKEWAERFSEIYVSAVNKMDLCGVWGINMEEYLLHKYGQSCEISKLRALEPWNATNGKPWSHAIKDKKVLIVHPFTDTMKEQYKKRKDIFSNKFDADDILPQMDIKYLKAVQSIGGEGAEGYKTWFDAYDYMLDAIKRTEFDIAILGCGAYGFPLAADIKRMGKQSIHLGGATQILFGIKGRRWENDRLVNTLYNDTWVSPLAAEKPIHADGVENGCYW